MQVVGEVIGRFRPPVGTVLPVVAAFTLIALFFWLSGWGFAGWVFPVGYIAGFVLLRSRQGLTVTTAGVACTRVGTRFLPWQEIRGFRPASHWRGGIWIDTSTGPVPCLTPCSWWGGPPDAAALRHLEALQPRQATPPG